MKKLFTISPVTVLSALGFGLAAVLPLHAQDAEDVTREREGVELADKVVLKRFNFAGYDDPKTTLAEFLVQVLNRHNVSIQVNERAFKADKVEDVLQYEFVRPNPFPQIPMATLGRILDVLLDRLPAESGALYVVREGFIEITTRKAVREELGRGPGEPIPPLVYIRFDQEPLELALRQVALRTGLTVVLDPKTGEKGKAGVSAMFKSVPADSVVRVLADMTELKPVRIDNMIYVTTAEKAAQMRKEQEELKTTNPRRSRLNPPPAR